MELESIVTVTRFTGELSPLNGDLRLRRMKKQVRRMDEQISRLKEIKQKMERQ
jgi:hypothetical protein